MEKRKRYWLFVYDQYYPEGGMNDYEGDFDTEKEAKEYFKKNWATNKFVAVFDSEEYVYEERYITVA